jgi:hypothetical protein
MFHDLRHLGGEGAGAAFRVGKGFSEMVRSRVLVSMKNSEADFEISLPLTLFASC